MWPLQPSNNAACFGFFKVFSWIDPNSCTPAKGLHLLVSLQWGKGQPLDTLVLEESPILWTSCNLKLGKPLLSDEMFMLQV